MKWNGHWQYKLCIAHIKETSKAAGGGLASGIAEVHTKIRPLLSAVLVSSILTESIRGEFLAFCLLILLSQHTHLP